MKLLNTKEGYVTLLMGRQANGVTRTLLKEAANHADEGEDVLFVSYEMYKRTVNDYIKCFVKFKSNNQNLISIISPGDMSLEFLSNLIRNLKPQVVYIDYLVLIRTEKYDYVGKNWTDELRNEQRQYIIEVLSNLAKELNIKIILAHHLPRFCDTNADIVQYYKLFKEVDNYKQRIIPMLVQQQYDENKVNTYKIEDDEIKLYASYAYIEITD